MHCRDHPRADEAREGTQLAVTRSKKNNRSGENTITRDPPKIWVQQQSSSP